MRIIAEKMSVKILGMIIGSSFFKMPYASQQRTPAINTRYMFKEMSLVFLVRITRSIWGINAIVVRSPAT